MQRQISQRREFQEAFSCYSSVTPTVDIPESVKRFHVDLLREEVGELETASDIIGVLDALADTLYALLGAAFSFGVEGLLEEAFRRVHESNMSKLGIDGRPILRGDGKFMKGPSYFRPKLEELVDTLNEERT